MLISAVRRRLRRPAGAPMLLRRASSGCRASLLTHAAIPPDLAPLWRPASHAPMCGACQHGVCHGITQGFFFVPRPTDLRNGRGVLRVRSTVPCSQAIRAAASRKAGHVHVMLGCSRVKGCAPGGAPMFHITPPDRAPAPSSTRCVASHLAFGDPSACDRGRRRREPACCPVAPCVGA